jgi:hypothetical protein
MTHTKDEALKLALEALEHIDYEDNDRDFLFPYQCTMLDNAITAIKQALSDATHLDETPSLAAPVQPVASYKGPEELWLQLHGDCSDDELTEPVDYTDDSVTWCWHQIYDSDVRYVREDTAAQPAPEVCCGEYTTCLKPCTPRGEFLALSAKEPRPTECRRDGRCQDAIDNGYEGTILRFHPPAQPAPVPLTDEQIKAVIAKIDQNEHYLPNALRQLARAIEAAHGIKGAA